MKILNGRLFFVFLAVFFGFLTSSYGQDAADNPLSQADTYFEAGNYRLARQAYQNYINNNAQGAYVEQAMFRLGDCYKFEAGSANNNFLSQSISAYELALARFPDSLFAPGASLRLAQAYITKGFIQDAIIQLRRARENFPQAENAREILLLLADSYYQLDDFDQAAIYFNAFTTEFPTDARISEVKAKLADSNHSSGNYGRARELFDEVIAKSPQLIDQNTQMKFQYAESLLFTNAFAEAKTILEQLAAREDLPRLKFHILYRLADYYRLFANSLPDGDLKNEQVRLAMDQYLDVYNECSDLRLAESAMLRFTQVADANDVDVEETFQLESIDTLLNTIFTRNLDPKFRSLVLIRLARHHRAARRYHRALEYYKKTVLDFQGMELIIQVAGEYRRLVRDLMNASWLGEDYSRFIDFYLGYGQGLTLTEQERIRLAISYNRVGLYQKAENLIKDLLQMGIDADAKKTLSIELIDLYFNKKDYVSASREIANVLAMNPSAQEREHALITRQKIIFNERDLIKFQKYYLEETDEFDTERLRASGLVKLGTLYFIKNNLEEARVYLEEFQQEFGRGETDNAELYDWIKQTTLTLADLYYQQNQTEQAMNLYETYLFYFNRYGDISWPLLQLANCRMRVGDTTSASLLYEEFLRMYPDHYLKTQANSALQSLQTN